MRNGRACRALRLRLIVSLATAVTAAGAACAPVQQTRVDLLIRGGTLVDGTGSEPRFADVAIVNGRIHTVGRLDGFRAARVIDATGLVVAPGFIDLHSHADLILLADRPTQERLLAAKIGQGVTTVIVGKSMNFVDDDCADRFENFSAFASRE